MGSLRNFSEIWLCPRNPENPADLENKTHPLPVLAQPGKETVRKQERGKEQPMNRRIITVCENFKEFTDFLLAELNKEPLEGKIPCYAGPIRD